MPGSVALPPLRAPLRAGREHSARERRQGRDTLRGCNGRATIVFVEVWLQIHASGAAPLKGYGSRPSLSPRSTSYRRFEEECLRLLGPQSRDFYIGERSPAERTSTSPAAAIRRIIEKRRHTARAATCASTTRVPRFFAVHAFCVGNGSPARIHAAGLPCRWSPWQ